MPGILELPEVRQRVSPLTVDEYHRLDEHNERGRRTELIRGIVIEKMSRSPLHAALYAEAGVNEYWIVLGATRQIEVYRRPEGGSYRERAIFDVDALLESAVVPDVRLRVAELFA
ncbi:MAG: Uma2 family endonuclease [Verrucomicrobiae bacterium]|nr:Uma2 family endonuclease [Verrucomicrobiae bacterium]